MPIDAFCNGTSECPHDEDEELAPQGSCCPENQFRCRVAGFQDCRERDLVCDGMEDCDDGEDERNCKSCTILSQNELGNRREEGEGRKRSGERREGKGGGEEGKGKEGGRGEEGCLAQ